MTREEILAKYRSKPKARLDLTKINGNAFSLMGNWQEKAWKEGWSGDETKEVIDLCMQGDYTQLVSLLDEFCDPPEETVDWYAEGEAAAEASLRSRGGGSGAETAARLRSVPEHGVADFVDGYNNWQEANIED
jgi:hypothetical protein